MYIADQLTRVYVENPHDCDDQKLEERKTNDKVVYFNRDRDDVPTTIIVDRKGI